MKRTSVFAGILGVSLSLGFGSGHAACGQPGAPHAGASPTKLALLVGINHYKFPDRVSPLAGAINDVDDMRQLLIGKYDFAPENIITLKDAEATHAAIIAAIETQLIAKAKPGDIVVFQFSGHGSQMKSGTGQISGLDETIVPYDSRDPAGKVFDISGGELHPLLLQLAARTKNLTFILDSCHSGTLVRGAVVRSVEPDTRTPPPLTRNLAIGAGSSTAGDGRVTAKFALISAATSRESAFEHYAAGREHGALTYFLTAQLRAAGPNASYRDVMDAVAANVEANYPTQHPSLEGVEGDQVVFGDTTSLSKAYSLASPEPGDAHHMELQVGQVQGATVGSEYDVYPPGSKLFRSPDKPLAHVQLATVAALTSEATILSGGPVPVASRAVERRHRYGNARLRVYLDGPADSQILPVLKGSLDNVKYVELVTKPALANVVVAMGSGSIEVVAADRSPLSPSVPLDDPQAADRVVTQVQQWARWFSVFSLHNAQPEFTLRFALTKGSSRDPMMRLGRANLVATEGEMVSASLTNQGDRDVYVAMLDLASDGSINVIYPGVMGGQEVLKPGATLTRTFRAVVPKDRDAVTDVLKAFASYRPIDLRPLTMRAIRSFTDFDANPDELEELLMDAAGDARGVVPLLAKPVDLGTWNAAQQILSVQKPG